MVGMTDSGDNGDDNDEERIPGMTTWHHSGVRRRHKEAGATHNTGTTMTNAGDDNAECRTTTPNAGQQHQMQDNNTKCRTTTLNAGQQHQMQEGDAERRGRQ
jgi:hypothetical protein